MIIVEACGNCRWGFICKEETEAGVICDEYELDRLSDDYVDGVIERQREEFLVYYDEYICEG